MSKRDKYRDAFTAAMKARGADPTEVIAKLAKRFRISISGIAAGTRELRQEMGLVRKRNGKKRRKMTPQESGRLGGKAGNRRSKKTSAPAAWDLTGMPVDQAARVLQVLSAQWPALRAAFFELDQALVTS